MVKINLITFSDPTPSQFGFKWELSTKDELKNYEIREQLARVAYPKHKVAFWNDYLPSLERLARGEGDALNPANKQPYDSRFRTGNITQIVQLFLLCLNKEL